MGQVLATRSLKRPMRIAIVAIGVVAIVLAVLQLYPREASTSPVAIDGVSEETLADEGITISPPVGDYRPRVDSNVAEEFANHRYPDVAIRQTVLAQFTRSNPDGSLAARVDRPVWAVNLDPQDPDLVPEGVGGKTEFALIFVDADTGEFIFGLTHTAPPLGGWGPDVGPNQSEGPRPQQ